ncbi:hypothetical protein ACOSQ4_017173 [Xanthoceras sorbifolium]
MEAMCGEEWWHCATKSGGPRLQTSQLPQATQNQQNQTIIVSNPSITTTPKQRIHVHQQLQSNPSTTTTPAAPKFDSSTILRTLEPNSIQAHITRRGDRGSLIKTEPLQHQIHAPQQHQRTGSEPTKQHQSVDQRSHQQLEIAPDLIRTQSTKEREGKEQRGRRIYDSRPNPATSYQ